MAAASAAGRWEAIGAAGPANAALGLGAGRLSGELAAGLGEGADGTDPADPADRADLTDRVGRLVAGLGAVPFAAAAFLALAGGAAGLDAGLPAFAGALVVAGKGAAALGFTGSGFAAAALAALAATATGLAAGLGEAAAGADPADPADRAGRLGAGLGAGAAFLALAGGVAGLDALGVAGGAAAALGDGTAAGDAALLAALRSVLKTAALDASGWLVGLLAEFFRFMGKVAWGSARPFGSGRDGGQRELCMTRPIWQAPGFRNPKVGRDEMHVG